jgi:hypothetical protein
MSTRAAALLIGWAFTVTYAAGSTATFARPTRLSTRSPGCSTPSSSRSTL